MTDELLPDDATLSSMARAAAATGVPLEQIKVEWHQEQLRAQVERLLADNDTLRMLHAAQAQRIDYERVENERVKAERDRFAVELERLVAVLNQIATDYYHDRHAIWAVQALRVHQDG